MNNKKVIYALFDDGIQSVKTTLEPLGYEVYSFGIQKKKTVIFCDLTDIENFFSCVKDLPLPDYLFANPPCETFSIGTSSSYASGKKGNLYYYSNGEPINDFEDWKTTSFPNVVRMKMDKKQYFKRLVQRRDVSETLHANTDIIVNHFNVPSIIENPQTSYAWKFFHKEFKKTLAHYIAYDGNFSKKPTYFASNFELKLKLASRTTVQTRNLKHHILSYNERSTIPKELIIDIMRQMRSGTVIKSS